MVNVIRTSDPTEAASTAPNGGVAQTPPRSGSPSGT